MMNHLIAILLVLVWPLAIAHGKNILVMPGHGSDPNEKMMTALCGGKPLRAGGCGADCEGDLACSGCPIGHKGHPNDRIGLELSEAYPGSYTSDRPQVLAATFGCFDWAESELILMTLTDSGWHMEQEIPRSGDFCIKVYAKGKRDALVCLSRTHEGDVERRKFELLTFPAGHLVRQPLLDGFWTQGNATEATHMNQPTSCSKLLPGVLEDSYRYSFEIGVISSGLAQQPDDCKYSKERASRTLKYIFDGKEAIIAKESAAELALVKEELRESTVVRPIDTAPIKR